MQYVSLIVLIVLATLQLPAQFVRSYKHLTPEDGLPGTEVYQVKSDREGYLWFCTDRGVTRYDGDEFTHFTLKDGLTDHTIFACFQDHKDRMWFVCYNRSLCYFENDSIYPYRYNHIMDSVMGSLFGAEVYVDSNESVWLRMISGMLGIDSAGKVLEFRYRLPADHPYDLQLDLRNPIPYILRLSKHYNPEIELFKPDGERIIVNGPDFKLEYASGAVEARLVHNGIVFTDGLGVFHLDSQYHVLGHERLGDNTRSIYEDQEQNIWLGFFGNGAYRFNGGQIGPDHDIFLNGTTVSSIVQDFEGNYWFTTLGNGVFYLKNQKVKTFQQKPRSSTQKIDKIVADSNGVLVRFYNGRAYYIEGDSLVEHQPAVDLRLPIAGSGRVYYMLFNYPRRRVHSTYMLDSRTMEIIGSKEDAFFSGRSLSLKSGGFVEFSSNPPQDLGLHAHFYEELELIKTIKLHDDPIRPRKTSWVGDSLAAFCDQDGLFVAKLDGHSTIDTIDLGVPLKFARMNDACSYGEDLLVASHYYGLIIRRGEKNYYLDQEDGLPSNQINDLLLVQDTLWMSTTRGIIRLKLSEDYLTNPKMDVFGHAEGLISNDCYEAAYHDGKIWIASDHGLSVIEADWTEQVHTAPRLKLNNIRVNSEILALDQLTNLGYQQNNLHIDLKAIGYRNREQYRFYYRLSQDQEVWEESPIGMINLAQLAPGSYQFEAYVSNGFQTSEELINFPIYIAPPLWKETWFILLCGVFILSMATAFFAYRLRLQKEADQLNFSRELAEKEKLMAEDRLQVANLQNELLDSRVKWQQQRLVSRLVEGSANNELFSRLKKELHTLLVLDKRKRQSKTRELILQINQYGSSETTWKEFHDQFDQMNPGFFERLHRINPELTSNDLRYCSLIRMNLNAKEVGGILNVSPDTVRIARYRLKKKLNLQADQKLSSFLLEI